jgi:hypothetical protein
MANQEQLDNIGKSLQARTDAKLRYAKIHLDELAALAVRSGDDFDRAHQESFLFHLFGARDAFLAELNHYYACGLPQDHLSVGKLRESLQGRGLKSPELAELYKLEQTDGSWFQYTKDLRDHSTHVQGVPRAFFLHVGVEVDPEVGREVWLKNPRTQRLIERDFVDQFREWHVEMNVLILRLRESALKSA